VVRANDKKFARLSVIRNMLTHLYYAGKDHSLTRPNPGIIFTYAEDYLHNGMIAP
jgi:hypothetical protein